MTLLGTKDTLDFCIGGKSAEIAGGIPIFRNLDKDQRSAWPTARPPEWAALTRELEASRSAYFMLITDGAKQVIEILTGQLVIRSNIGDSREGQVLWLLGISYATSAKRKRFVLSGQPIRHLGIMLDGPSALRSRIFGKPESMVARVLTTLNSIAATSGAVASVQAARTPLTEVELGLLETLTTFVDSEHEIEQQAAQSEASYAYVSVQAEPGRRRFKSLVRFSLVSSDFKRLADQQPPIQLLAFQMESGERLILGVEELRSTAGATDLIASMEEQGGVLSLTQTGSLARAPMDVLKRVRNATVDLLRSQDADNPWLVRMATLPGPLAGFEASDVVSPAAGNLNPSQREAVGKGLATPDLMLVLGPPGTGKTTVIHTWVDAFVKQGKRVLVTSQSNKAVDNVLERLKRDEKLTCVRLGGEAKVSSTVADLLIDNRAIELQKQLLVGIEASACMLSEIKRTIAELQLAGESALAPEEFVALLHRYDASISGYGPALEQGLAKLMTDPLDRAQADTQAALLHLQEVELRIAGLRSRSGPLAPIFKAWAWVRSFRLAALRTEAVEQRESLRDACTRVLKTIDPIQALVEGWRENLGQTRQQELYPLLIRLVDVVGATCIGVNTSRHFKDVGFDVVIIDESAQIQLHNLMVPMAKAPHVILVGDHKQLPPVVQEELITEVAQRAETSAIEFSDELLRKSWFEIAWNELPLSRRSVLDTQFRCPAVISDFISEAFYENSYFAADAMKTKTALAGFKSPMVFIDTSGLPSGQRAERSRRADGRDEVMGNACETEILVELLRMICTMTPTLAEDGQIGIIIPYKNHVAEVQRRVEKDRRHGLLNSLRTPTKELVASVDSYQGQEREVILFAFTRSNARGAVGFLADWRRLNVAMTRTKRQLIMVGDLSTLTKHGAHERPDHQFKQAMQLLVKHIHKSGELIAAGDLTALLSTEVGR